MIVEERNYKPSILSIQVGVVSGLPQIPKPADAQVSHIKWCSMVSPPYLWLLHPQIQRVTALRVYCLQSQNTVVQK